MQCGGPRKTHGVMTQTNPAQATQGAAISRFRPILLTSMTTFVGLLPLMLNRSVQAQFLVPMAVSLAFGVAFSTLVTVLVVPAVYVILEDLRGLRGASERKSPLIQSAADR